MPQAIDSPVVVLARTRRFVTIVSRLAGRMRLVLCPTPMALLGAVSIDKPRLVLLEAVPAASETRQLIQSLHTLGGSSPPRILLVVRTCDVPTRRRALMAGVDTVVCDLVSAGRLSTVVTCLLRATTSKECNQCEFRDGSIQRTRERTATQPGLERFRLN